MVVRMRSEREGDLSVRRRARSVPGRVEAALLALMRSRPLADIRVSDVIREAGCSRGSFYRYYADLDDLLARIVDEEARDYARIVFQTIAASAEGGRDSEGTYRLALEFALHARARADFYALLLGDSPSVSLDRFCELAVSHFRELGEDSLPAGINADFYYYVTTRTFLACLRYWLDGPREMTPEQFAEQVALVTHAGQA